MMNKAVKGLVVALAVAASSVAFAQQNAPQAPQTGVQAPAGQFAAATVPGYYGAPVVPAYYGPSPYAYGPYYGPGYWGGPYGGGRGHGSGHMSFSMSGSGWGNGNNGWW
jgi:hypothetical protein